MPTEGVRIALIHALEESVLPARRAFASDWPEAFCFDLLDTSLAPDRAEASHLDAAMMERIQRLAHYAADTQGKGGHTRALLFTCSAFGPAIDAVKSRLPIPVLRPNEAAFEEALGMGNTIGLAVTFAPSLAALSTELQAMAAARGRSVTVLPVLAEAALAALKAGDETAHDQLAARACRDLGQVDVLVLGQFSLARAAPAIRAVTAAPVLTTPGSAVRALRHQLFPYEGRSSPPHFRKSPGPTV